MGYLESSHGMHLLGDVPEGACPECAATHNPSQPHNRDSLFYQYNFYDKNGCWPTWVDTMSHCPEEVKKLWIAELEARDILVTK